VRLAREMTTQTLAPGEVAPMHNLYVVTRGLVLYGGRVLSRGMSWGDDVILSDPIYFLPFHARAMTYVDVNVLSADTLMQVLAIFPASRQILRKKVIRLALRRHLVAARKMEEEAAKAQAAGGRPVNSFRSTLLDNLSRHNKTGMEENLGATSVKDTARRGLWRGLRRKGTKQIAQAAAKIRVGVFGDEASSMTAGGDETSLPPPGSDARVDIQQMALLLQDKQMTQSEWRDAGRAGGKRDDGPELLRHEQLMGAINALAERVGAVEKELAERIGAVEKELRASAPA